MDIALLLVLLGLALAVVVGLVTLYLPDSPNYKLPKQPPPRIPDY